MSRSAASWTKRLTIPVFAVCLVGALLVAPTALADSAYPCAADASWVTDPNPPQEIPDGGQDFCDFYQFGWQWFLALGYPDAAIIVQGADRIFQDRGRFPEWVSPADSCGTWSDAATLFVRDLKSDDPGETIPDRTGQAGGGAVIYDQNENVVYYNVQFSRNLCNPDISGDLPAGTTELKTSWRLLDGDESGYFTMNVVIDGVNDNQPVDLGLVGFHLFRTTTQHPEGVWITFEHKSNAPDCTDPEPTPAGGWSFTSDNCAACLAGGGENCSDCQFNVADATSTDPDPTEICRFYRDGTKEGDNKADENFAVVDELNDQLVGPEGIITKLPADDPMAIWANYFNVGALWVSDPSQPANDLNQRGSLQLANTTMETTFQGGPGASSTVLNCFNCHGYTPGKTATSGLSHIFDSIHGSSSGGESKSAHRGAHDLTFVKAHRPQPAPAKTDRE